MDQEGEEQGREREIQQSRRRRKRQLLSLARFPWSMDVLLGPEESDGLARWVTKAGNRRERDERGI
jgi:hypothetical protein